MPHAFTYLIQTEVQFLDAAVSRLIPEDELGPGAKQADVTLFIDRQLSGSWGTHGRNYRMGPWREGTPQQGFQSPLTPQEIYRAAIREADIYCIEQYGKNFCFLTIEQQDEILQLLEGSKIDLTSVSSKLFFELLLRNTFEGFFSDPMYGGNKDKVGWKLLDFPGVAAADYAQHLEMPQYVPYRVEPVSILDIREGRVDVDSEGYPKRVVLDSRE